MKNNILPIVLYFILSSSVYSQYILSGKVLEAENRIPLEMVNVILEDLNIGTVTDSSGVFRFSDLPKGQYYLQLSYVGKKTITDTLFMDRDINQLRFYLEDDTRTMEKIVVSGVNENKFSLQHLQQVDQMAIYASKKTELVIPDQLAFNKAANTSRLIYARISGLNIWESDGAGVQLGLGGRGLSPNRNANFNTRQNGYDISADALGYPESYYAPPSEAIRRIEIVRGAASLQYGTQFGGMLNFVFKEAEADKKIQIHSRQTLGSFGFFSSFNSLAGDHGKVKYYSFYQYKTSKGWRPNSSLNQHTAYAGLEILLNENIRLRPELTHMNYLAQQPGGLTDAQFAENPKQSFRRRNWFAVNWNLAALNTDIKISNHLKLNNQSFGLLASRHALGNLDNIQLLDFGQERDLLHDRFKNWGNELRLMYQYNKSKIPSVFLTGARYYHGKTHRQQGLGDNTDQPHFDYLYPDQLEGSDFILPSRNLSLFAENLFNISKKWSITPGLRSEWIRTATDGYYRIFTKDLAGNILSDEIIDEKKSSTRQLLLAGLGTSFKPKSEMEIYSNFSQNFRAINFNDIRVNVGNLVVDENLKDEKGFNLDLGLRGTTFKKLDYDVSLFYLSYRDRIGTILKKEPNPLFNNLTDRIIRFRTNIADAGIYGLESMIQYHLIGTNSENYRMMHLTIFTNLSLTEAQYHAPEKTEIHRKEVELVPPVNIKAGLDFQFKSLQVYFQYSYTGRHFSDASNAISTPSAIEGIIPSYSVADLSFRYHWNKFEFEAGINNIFNAYYFTRRATGYPGPGIIPSDSRSFYLTAGIKI